MYFTGNRLMEADFFKKNGKGAHYDGQKQKAGIDRGVARSSHISYDGRIRAVL